MLSSITPNLMPQGSRWKASYKQGNARRKHLFHVSLPCQLLRGQRHLPSYKIHAVNVGSPIVRSWSSTIIGSKDFTQVPFMIYMNQGLKYGNLQAFWLWRLNRKHIPFTRCAPTRIRSMGVQLKTSGVAATSESVIARC